MVGMLDVNAYKLAQCNRLNLCMLHNVFASLVHMYVYIFVRKCVLSHSCRPDMGM